MFSNRTAASNNALTCAARKWNYEKMELKKALKGSLLFGLLLILMWLQDFFSFNYKIIISLILGIFFGYHLMNFMRLSRRMLLQKPLHADKEKRKLKKSLKESLKVRKNEKEKINLVGTLMCSETKEDEEELMINLEHSKANPKSQKLNLKFKRATEAVVGQDPITDECSLREFLKSCIKDGAEEEFELQMLLSSGGGSSSQQTAVQPSTERDLLADISDDCMLEYILKIRHWVSITILKPLLEEIDATNIAFHQLGLGEFQIGITELERLRRFRARKESLSERLRRLPFLMQYLEICPNQIYLLQRFRCLSNGFCLSHFTSNVEIRRVPNDPSIVFQCFCIYMNRQLMAFDDRGEVALDARCFYEKYVITNDGGRHSLDRLRGMLKNDIGCAIVYTDSSKPKFNLMTTHGFYYEKYGFNNLFQVIIGFITYIKQYNRGMLEGVSLGRNGVNILWAIDESD